MAGFNVINATQCDLQSPSLYDNVSDIYFCVFFDGTSNNCWEQSNKRDRFIKKLKSLPNLVSDSVHFAFSPSLFSEDNTFAQQLSDQKEYRMANYKQQLEQSERNLIIEDAKTPKERGKQKQKDNNSGWKYSNVAILRSMAQLADTTGKKKESYNGKIGLRYNLYIEGSGAKWDKGSAIIGSDSIGLGMGTGRTGVVGLVSKAMVFIYNYLSSLYGLVNDSVTLHFAIFGFSRGSTCGRLFSYLISEENPNNLPKKEEFKQFLPENMYIKFGIDFLQNYKNKTVDFLGIYDTVSSIGFLHKDDDSANYSLNQFKSKSYEISEENTCRTVDGFVNQMHNIFPQKSDAKNNFHRDNVTNYGLYSPQLDKVKHTLHICAIDEYRENFALVDLGKELKNTCTEVFLPGCHSDIGGGIMFDDDIEKMTLRRKINGKPTKMIKRLQPLEITISNISQDTLNELGWLNETAETHQIKDKHDKDTVLVSYEKEYFNTKEIKKRSIDTFGKTAYIYQDNDKIEFEHFAKEGYSNITLHIMFETAIKKLKREGWPTEYMPFKEGQKLPVRFEIPNLLNVLLDYNLDYCEGERHWVIPKDPKKYKALRTHYLHFSCTDELNLEKMHITQTFANLGNPPYWLSQPSKETINYYLLCRLVYHGDRGDNGLYDITKY